MIDNKARNYSLSILNKIKEQRLSNWQLEESWPESKIDPAINCILRWLWTLYDDDSEIIMIDVLTNEDRKIFDRCCEFLGTDIEFNTLTLTDKEEAEFRKEWGKEWRCDCSSPNDNYWPFPNKT